MLRDDGNENSKKISRSNYRQFTVDNWSPTIANKRELKQQRRRRLRLWLRKRQLQSVFALLQTLSRVFHLIQLVKC